jgi:hypothetical protein
MASEGPPETNVPLAWVGYDEQPVLLANQFLLQTQPDQSVVLGIGQMTPPPMTGTPEQIAEQVSQIEFIPIRTLARVGLTEQALRELAATIQAHLDKYDRARSRLDPRGEH